VTELAFQSACELVQALRAGEIPIGLQAVGGECHDYITIEFARLLSKEIGGFEAPAAYRED